MTQRSDRARVQALLDEGRITAAEAEILFAALDDVEGSTSKDEEPNEDEPDSTTRTTRITPEQTREEARARAHETAEKAREKARAAREKAQEAVQRSSDTNDNSSTTSYGAAAPQPPSPRAPTLPEPPTPPPGPYSAQSSISTYPAGQRVTKLSGFCGDLDVRTDPTISEPNINGNASLTWDGNVCTIRTPSRDGEGGRNWLARLHRAAGDLKVRLPQDMSLELSITAGDGAVRGVREVRGSFTGGDFDLRGAEVIDLTATAGDISVHLRPTSGKQRLRATSGDIDLVFLEGSSVRVSGKATSGDLDLPHGFTREGGLATQRFSGTVGSGDAELELRLTAGDVNVKLEHK